MSSPIHSSMLEEMVTKITRVPEPDEAFIGSLRERFISAGQANARQGINKPIRTFRTRRLVWGMIIVLLILAAILAATSPTVVTALKRLLGYAPGVGVVEQGLSLRVLEKPVSVEREGIRMTAVEAAADSTHTVVGFKVEWLNPPSTEGEHDTSCLGGYPELKLADGSLVSEGVTKGKNVMGNGYSYVMEFSSLPADQNDAILAVPCLVSLFPGTLPQNWEVPLHFVPAAHLNLAPVVEVPTVTPIPTPILNNSKPVLTYGITLALDKVAELDSGYFFMGHVSWTDPGIRPYGVTLIQDKGIKLTDASGGSLPMEEKIPEASADTTQTLWAYQCTGKGKGPLTLTLDSVMVDLATENASFQFDPGPDPQLNQSWSLDKDVEAGGHRIHVVSAELSNIPGLEPQVLILTFTMQSDPAVGMAALTDIDHPHDSGGGGGGFEPGPITSNVYYDVKLPAGPLNIGVTDVTLKVDGPWQVVWAGK